MENQELMPMGNDQGSNQNLWISLPPEILSLILSDLAGGDKLIFHAVCKTWRSITNNAPPRPRPLPQLPLPSQIHDPSPWLFHIDPNKKIYRFVHPMYNDYTCEMDLPTQLLDTEIRYSNHGWVLLMSTRDHHQLFLFNPFTKEIIELPSLPSNIGNLKGNPRNPRILFFTGPPSRDCLVVAIAWCSFNRSIGVHKLGENNWETHESESDYSHYMGCCSNPILYKGLYYCWENEGKIAVFDVNDIEHSFKWIACKFPSRKFYFHYLYSLIQPFILEIGGELFGVINTNDDAKIHVFKLNIMRSEPELSMMRLEPVQSLGKNVLFISTGASFSTRAFIRGTCNTIYNGMNFPGGSSDLFGLYSLSTRKYHSFFDKDLTKRDCFDMKLILNNSSWLYPSCNVYRQ